MVIIRPFVWGFVHRFLYTYRFFIIIVFVSYRVCVSARVCIYGGAIYIQETLKVALNLLSRFINCFSLIHIYTYINIFSVRITVVMYGHKYELAAEMALHSYNHTPYLCIYTYHNNNNNNNISYNMWAKLFSGLDFHFSSFFLHFLHHHHHLLLMLKYAYVWPITNTSAQQH